MDNMKTWLDYLRTTDDAQGEGYLAAWADVVGGPVTAYCCLGIGCKVAGIPAIYDSAEQHYAFDSRDILAPASFIRWLGFDEDSEGREIDDACQYDLRVEWSQNIYLQDVDDLVENTDLMHASGLNDNGFTFAQIADIIEYFGVTPVVRT